jgi:hypothetical protein
MARSPTTLVGSSTTIRPKEEEEEEALTEGEQTVSEVRIGLDILLTSNWVTIGGVTKAASNISGKKDTPVL